MSLRDLKRAYRWLASGLLVRLSRRPTNMERARIDRLRAEVLSSSRNRFRGVTQPEQAWARHASRLRHLIATDDPRRFLRWDVVRNTMFVLDATYLDQEFRYLRSHQDWIGRWRPAIQESAIGRPIPSLRYLKSSDNLIHHAYHVSQFEESTRTRVSECAFVLEFGPGYGSLTRLLFNLGFQGRVVLFDLPGFSSLQRFYLDGLGIKICDSVGAFIEREACVMCVSDLDELSQVLEASKSIRPSLFIGTWSVSETPRGTMDSVLSLARDFDGYLMSFQRQFSETDNLSFFRSWIQGHEGIDWQMWEIGHLPGNYYLMGSKKRGRLRIP